MAEQLEPDLAVVRRLLLDDQHLVRAVAAGRRRGEEPRWRRVEIRYVDLRRGRRLQVTSYDATQAFTANHSLEAAAGVVDDQLAQPFGSWHVWSEGTDGTHEEMQLRISKRGKVFVHQATRHQGTAIAGVATGRAHDRSKARLLAETDPTLIALGISDDDGRVKPSRRAKYRQVQEFLRALSVTLDEALASGAMRMPTRTEPLRIVDLGCGNAYLTFSALRYLTEARELPTMVVGADAKDQSLAHNTSIADQLGVADRARFIKADIGALDAQALFEGAGGPDVVLALHACDTATDDALAKAVQWQASVVLAAPCCHHDVAAQLKRQGAQAAYPALVRDGILRERLADTLTDALRAARMRVAGYRVDVVEFVESKHTPRNTLIRAVRTGAPPDDQPTGPARDELDELMQAWRVTPRLVELLR